MEYVSLRDAKIDVVHKVLRATGAIAGFLPRVYGQHRLSGLTVSELPELYYDAGCIDNTPVAPLLELDLCDVLIVVLLNHEIEDPSGYLWRYLDEVNDRVRQANPDISDDVWAALASFRVVYPARVSSDNLKDVQLVPIVPSMPLGVHWWDVAIQFEANRRTHENRLSRCPRSNRESAQRHIGAYAHVGPPSANSTDQSTSHRDRSEWQLGSNSAAKLVTEKSCDRRSAP
jgi:predicted acylesterase/phospholipase RssA